MTNIIPFPERLAKGEELEDRVTEELERRGWTVWPFGQGTWPEEARRAVKASDSDLRFLPDLGAARNHDVVFVDCKNTMKIRDGDFHSINRRCLEAGRKWAPRHDWPLYYVFDQLGVMTPHQVMDWQRMRRLGNAGSFIRIPRHMPMPFDEIFGAPERLPGTGLRAA